MNRQTGHIPQVAYYLGLLAVSVLLLISCSPNPYSKLEGRSPVSLKDSAILAKQCLSVFPPQVQVVQHDTIYRKGVVIREPRPAAPNVDSITKDCQDVASSFYDVGFFEGVKHAGVRTDTMLIHERTTIESTITATLERQRTATQQAVAHKQENGKVGWRAAALIGWGLALFIGFLFYRSLSATSKNML